MSAGRRTGIAITIALALLMTPPAHAEMDHRDYQVKEMTGPAAARSELQRRIEAEGIEAARRAAEAQAAAEAARRAHEAELTARPYPVRLAEARCTTTCHGPERFADTRHGWLGWLLVILRMRYFNRAELSWQDMWVISKYLATTYPAELPILLFEWIAPLLLLSALLVLLSRYKKKRFTSNHL